ncbi:hypothetical protein V6N13_147909 [Hibiscus sabdariffa]
MAEVSESVDHVLRHCPLVKAVWTSVVKLDRISEFLSMDLKNWFVANLSQPGYFGHVESDWDILFAALVWSIWLRRNKLIFESASAVCEPVLLVGNRIVEEFRTAVTADCKEALQMIDRARHSTRRSALVEHIIRLLNRDWVVCLEFVPREGNVVADYMAKRDCGDDFICHRLVSPPDGIRSLL